MDIATDAAETITPADWRDLFQALTGVDLSACPHCGGTMLRYRVDSS